MHTIREFPQNAQRYRAFKTFRNIATKIFGIHVHSAIYIYLYVSGSETIESVGSKYKIDFVFPPLCAQNHLNNRT